MARPRNKYLAMPYLIDGTDYPTDAEVASELEGRNATIQYQEDGVDIGTKGGIETVNFIGTGITANDQYVGEVQSNTDGVYNLMTEQLTSTPHYLVAYKPGSPDTAGTTVNTLLPTAS